MYLAKILGTHFLTSDVVNQGGLGEETGPLTILTCYTLFLILILKH